MSARRNRARSDLKRVRIAALRREGKSLAQIAKLTGWSYASVKLLAGQTPTGDPTSPKETT